MAIALLAAILVMATLMGCAPPTANNPGPSPVQMPAVELATTTPLPPDGVAATSFIDDLNGWAVGGELEDGVGSLVQRTTDGGRTWEVLYKWHFRAETEPLRRVCLVPFRPETSDFPAAFCQSEPTVLPAQRPASESEHTRKARNLESSGPLCSLVAGAGFEPTTFGL